jgi:hypothetical protein
MRIVQRYRITAEKEFWELEARFAELERRRPDFPKGRRMKPISGGEPVNTLIWECEFPTMEAAHKTLAFFDGDPEHEALFKLQGPLFEEMRVEFFESR